jgi:hypothetical protein
MVTALLSHCFSTYSDNALNLPYIIASAFALSAPVTGPGLSTIVPLSPNTTRCEFHYLPTPGDREKQISEHVKHAQYNATNSQHNGNPTTFPLPALLLL